MSRPFSYNDENFTVIGNMLFMHIFITESVNEGDIAVNIPPEINKRLFSDNITVLYEGIKAENHNYGTFRLGRVGNTLIALDEPITANELLKAIEPLKDI